MPYNKLGISPMIKHFTCKETQKIWEGERSKKIPSDIQQRARRKLRMLNAACDINDLRIPPSNMLEKLTGDRASQYSIRINKQWRVCFEWENGTASFVEIVDYH